MYTAHKQAQAGVPVPQNPTAQPRAAAVHNFFINIYTAGGGCATRFSAHPETRKATLISQRGLFNLMRRRPTLPHTFAYSTIGPAGLNFRVRDGNGWNPRGKITANLTRLWRGC